MNFNQIEKEFDEQFPIPERRYQKMAGMGLYETETGTEDFVMAQQEWNIEMNNWNNHRNFLKQSFIKYLKDECERLEQEKNSDEEIQFFMQGHPTSTDRYIGGKFAGANEVIDNQIKYYKAQIKELESLSN